MAVEYRCRNNDCRHWFPKSLGACPECGTEPYAFNKWLRTAALNNHLYGMAEGSREQKISAAQAAKEYVRDAS